MDEERVEYSYTGDVSSLRSATKQAISLLEQYEDTIKGLASSDKLNVGKTAFSGFQRTVNGVIKQVNSLSGYMSKASEESQNALAPDATAAIGAYQNIADALNLMRSGSKLSTEDFKLMTMVLQDTRKTLDPIVAKAQAMGTSFTKVAQMSEQSMAKVDSAVDSTSQKVSTDVLTLGQQWDNYANRMSKSAEMSAQVFAKAGKFTGFQTGVDNAVAKAVLMRSKVEETITGMVTKIKTMASAFDPMISKLTSYKTKATSTMDQVRKALDSVSAAFRRTSQSTDSSESEANQANTAHKRLAATAQQLGKIVKVESTALKTEQKTLESKNRELKNSSKQHSSLSSIIARLGQMFTSETSSAKAFTASLTNMSSRTGLLKKALSGLTATQIGRWLASAVKESINFIENLNLFTVAMGSSVDMGLEFVDTMSEIYGMDPSNLYRYAGYFYQLTDAIGMADDASSVLSLSLTKASNDIASLFNVDVATVVEDLASGMQGMSRSVRKYGMDIRNTTLQQTALKYSLTGQVESMSEANRMALRYLTMMEQVKNATSQTVEEIDGSTTVIGDFARNIETPANQLRIFKEQITQLGRAIGNFLVPMLKAVLPWINGVVMALRTALTTIATLLGFTESLSSSLSSSTESVEELGDSVSDTAKEIKNILAPFDELNILSDQSSGSGGLDSSEVLDPKLQEAIANMELGLDNVKMKANEVRDAILAFFGFETVEVFNVDTGEWETTVQWCADVFRANLIDKFPQWSATINALFDNWSSITSGLASLWEALGSVVDAVFTKIGELLDGLGIDNALAEGISGLAGSLEGLSSWINENSDSLANLILIVAGLVTAFKGFSTVSTLIGPVIKFISTVGSAISGFGTAIAVIAGIVAAIALLYTNSESFATSFNSLLQTFWTGLQPMADSIVNLFSTIWQSLQSLWTEHIQPMLQQTGDALAPVLDTIGGLWENVSVIFTDVANMLSRVWTSTIEPILGALMDAIGGVMEIFQTLWETVIGPVLGFIGDGFQHLWTQYLSPIVEDIIEIVGGLIERILNLWNTVLQPLVNFIVNLFGPPIAAVFQFIWTVVETAVGRIGSVIQVLTGTLSGIIEFLNGVFTGDWKRALSGLANVFVALGNGIIGVLESVCNFGVGAINSFLSLIVNGVEGVVNSLGGLVEDIAEFLGFELNLNVDWTVPQIPRVTIPRIPQVALAHGGVATGPTQALIGEGRYDEMVLPLGNSPQEQDFINRILEAQNSESSDVYEVHVYIGNEQVAEYMTKATRKQKIQTNGG